MKRTPAAKSVTRCRPIQMVPSMTRARDMLDFARQAVKTVALDAQRPKLARDGQRAGDRRHDGVECRVQAGHLRDTGKARLRRAHQRQRRRYVQGCERHGGLQILHHGCVDHGVVAALRPSMNDAVADGSRSRQVLRLQPLRDAGQRRLGFASCFFRAGDQHAASVCIHHEAAKLERRRADVQRQHGPTCVIAHAGQRQPRTSGRSSPCSLMWALWRAMLVS